MIGIMPFWKAARLFHSSAKGFGVRGKRVAKGGMGKRPLSANNGSAPFRLARHMFKRHERSKKFSVVASRSDGCWDMRGVWRDRSGQIFQIQCHGHSAKRTLIWAYSVGAAAVGDHSRTNNG